MKRLKFVIYAAALTSLVGLAAVIIYGFTSRNEFIAAIGVFALVPWTFMCLILTWLYHHVKSKYDA